MLKLHLNYFKLIIIIIISSSCVNCMLAQDFGCLVVIISTQHFFCVVMVYARLL